MNHLVDQYFDSLSDKKVAVLGIGVSNRPLLRLLNGSEGIFVEPSAAISAAAYMGMMGESCTDYLKKHGLDEKMSRAAHILWATGGGLVPETERKELCGTGAKR